MSDAVTEILPNLFAIGGWLPLDGRPISWIPTGVTGYLPVQGFALRDAGQWLLIDTGLPVHRTEIHSGIAETSAGCHQRRLIVTRREADCMLNIPWILRDFDIHEVLYAGALDPLDFFAGIEDAEVAGRLSASGATQTSKIADGQVVPVGGLRLEVLRTELRLLSTNWFYEQVTATLFTSDAFAFLTASAPGSRISPLHDFDAAAIASFLGAKMDWLLGIDQTPVIADLDQLQRSRPITRICPGFGCTIEGEAAVTHAFARLREALLLLGARPRPSIFGGFRGLTG